MGDGSSAKKKVEEEEERQEARLEKRSSQGSIICGRRPSGL
jgi:hypothetical protein